MNDIHLVLLFIFLPYIYAVFYNSSDVHLDCSRFPKFTSYKSYLLSEGDGLLLDCNICSKCSKYHELCNNDSFIRKFEPASTDDLGASGFNFHTILAVFPIEHIRLRLRKRIWRNITTLSDDLPLIYKKEHLQRDYETNLKLFNSLSLYFTVKKPGRDIQVISTNTTSTYYNKDKFRIKYAKIQHTGIYKCLYKGDVLAVWSVTVLKPGAEPFRHVILPMESSDNVDDHDDHDSSDGSDDQDGSDDHDHDGTDDQGGSDSGGGSGGNDHVKVKRSVDTASHDDNDDDDHLQHTDEDGLKPLAPQYLIEHNLKLFTYWYEWSDCIPCTLKDKFPDRLNVIRNIGMQTKIVKPYKLAVEIEELFKTFAGSQGIPCRSHLIRNAILKYGPKEIELRPSELVMRSCIRYCPIIDRSPGERERSNGTNSNKRRRSRHGRKQKKENTIDENADNSQNDDPFASHPLVKLQMKRRQCLSDIHRIHSRPTLLQMLLAEDIRKERNQLMQCIRYIVNENFFQE
ncbi:unnamed protein product [Schistosoma turkestanicum]|nr:unnamed protein product [Schistosoma turkestanicum]